MLRFVRTHVRWAGILIQLVGISISHIPLFAFGTFVFFLSYLWAHSIMEEMYLHIEDAANAEKQKKENENTDDQEG